MRVEIVNVTPALAASWLSTSEGNPRWKKSVNGKAKMYDERKVSKYVRDIQAGHWYQGTHTIGFGVDGKLKEGHHRLMAVLRAGIPVEMVVLYGITKEGERHIDDNSVRQESARTGVDRNVLAIPNVHYACVNRFELINSKSLTTDEKLRFIDLHPCVFEIERIAHSGGKENSLLHFAGGTHALMCAFEYGVSITKLEDFVKAVRTGFTNDNSESAAVCIRNDLLKARKDANSKRNVYFDYAIQAAIYDFCNGIPRRRTYHPKTGVYFDMNIAIGNKLYTSMWGDY